MIKTIHQNIIESDAQYIAHQCNCISKNYSGLAKTIFDAFPEANTYNSPRQFETISIHGKIINMYSQIYPGKSKYEDSKEARLIAFEKCLNLILDIPDLQSIVMPYNIGCGLACGDWFEYLYLINNFAKTCESKKIKTFLCKWSNE